MRVAVLAIAIAGPGCGLGVLDTNADGTAGLPTAGAGPYGRLAIDDTTPAAEPQLLDDNAAFLSDPSVLRDDDGRLRVWYVRAPAGDPALAAIHHAEVPDEHDVPDVGPVAVVVADQAWEEGRVAAPSVIEDGAGLVMYYQGGATTPAIGVARSTDGTTWQKDPAPVLPAAGAPGAVIVDGATWLFVTRPGMPGIWRAVDAGQGFVLDAAPVVSPRPSLADAFDRATVGDPTALAVPRRGGGTRIHLWFTGTTEDPMEDPAVGYAGSFDGVTWERFGLENPMLAGFATGPSVVLEASRGLMVFAEPNRGRLAITVAEHP
jgi:hypothetical protein